MTVRGMVACCALLSAVARVPRAQQAIPVRELAPASARSVDTFRTILPLRELPGGNLLINDTRGRRLLRLDSALSHASVALESSSYPMVAAPLIAYAADSSLLVDQAVRILQVIDPMGHAARVIAPPVPHDFMSLGGSAAAIDDKGRVVYRSSLGPVRGGQLTTWSSDADSLLLLRATLDAQYADTIAAVKNWSDARNETSVTADGALSVRVRLNPLPFGDEWAVLSDGSVAIVRSGDYHIDWINPDGTARSTPPMPFDWKPLPDADKKRLIDSVAARPGSRGASAQEQARFQSGVLTARELPDRYPPFAKGAARADLDGNLWILPSSSRAEPVYDVVNRRGELFERVRLPANAAIAGFGRGGTVYLYVGDFLKGYRLERRKVQGM